MIQMPVYLRKIYMKRYGIAFYGFPHQSSNGGSGSSNDTNSADSTNSTSSSQTHCGVALAVLLVYGGVGPRPKIF